MWLPKQGIRVIRIYYFSRCTCHYTSRFLAHVSSRAIGSLAEQHLSWKDKSFPSLSTGTHFIYELEFQMPLSISRLPCFVCHSNKEKPIPNSTRTERLTRCIGSAFLVKFYTEGVTQNEDGRDVIADWVSNEQTRIALTGCNAIESGARYFHQSCLGREEAGALSYDNK